MSLQPRRQRGAVPTVCVVIYAENGIAAGRYDTDRLVRFAQRLQLHVLSTNNVHDIVVYVEQVGWHALVAERGGWPSEACTVLVCLPAIPATADEPFPRHRSSLTEHELGLSTPARNSDHIQPELPCFSVELLKRGEVVNDRVGGIAINFLNRI